MEEGGLELMIWVGDIGVFIREDNVSIFHLDEAKVETNFPDGVDGVGVLWEESYVGVVFNFGGEDDLYLDVIFLYE